MYKIVYELDDGLTQGSFEPVSSLEEALIHLPLLFDNGAIPKNIRWVQIEKVEA